jgi:hypothetical protein
VVAAAEQVEMIPVPVQLLAELVEVAMLKHLALLFKMALLVLVVVAEVRGMARQMEAQAVLALLS